MLVSFAGEGSGAGDLTWGQQVVWRGIELSGGEPNILTGVTKLLDGTTEQDEADLLSYLMSRHQSLRTRLRRDDEGHVRQVLVDSGETYLEIADAPDDADPLVFARAVETEFEHAPHDCVKDWPVWMTLVRHRGVPAFRVMGMCHLTSDGFGVLTLINDMGGLDPASGVARQLAPVSFKEPVIGMQPLEEAQWQNGPAGLRRSGISERYWERLLRSIPPRRFPDSRDPSEPRGGFAIYDSPATYLAIQPIAARLQTDTSPVLLAATAVAMTRIGGTNPVVLRVYVSNRFRSRLADTVSPVAQTCPCVIDLAGVTFDEAVKRAMAASIAAFKHAYYKPARIREVLAAVSEERGEAIDLDCVYNDRRLIAPREADASLPEAADVRAALEHSTLRWENQSDTPADSFHIHIRDNAEPTVNVLVAADSHYVASADVEAFLRELEAVTVQAAFEPDMRTGV